MKQGSVIPKGRNKWLLRWFVGRDGLGKRHYDSELFEGTHKQAQNALGDRAAARRINRHLRPGKQTVEEFYPDWLASKRGISAYTRSQYEARYDLDILPFFGKTNLRDVTPQLVAKWITWMQERSLGPRTIQYSVGVLKQILRLAFQWQLIPNIPTDGVELPAQQLKQRDVLSPEEMRTLLDHSKATGDVYAPLWAVLLTGGLRPQEAIALTVADLVGARVSISKAVKEENGKLVVGDTKTAKSRRTVALPQDTADLLRAHMRASGIIGGPIFLNRSGGYLDISKVRKAWRRACKAAGVPVVRLYDARHSHLTALLAAGVPLKVMSERAGHSSVKITGDIYSHVLPEMDDRAAQAMEALLTQPKQTAQQQSSGTLQAKQASGE